MAKPGWTLSVHAVEVTSEEEDYPIESALLSKRNAGFILWKSLPAQLHRYLPGRRVGEEI